MKFVALILLALVAGCRKTAPPVLKTEIHDNIVNGFIVKDGGFTTTDGQLVTTIGVDLFGVDTVIPCLFFYESGEPVYRTDKMKDERSHGGHFKAVCAGLK